MLDLSFLSPLSAQKLAELIVTLLPQPVQTVVLDTDLNDCYPAFDAGGNPIPVNLDITGSYTLPLGCSLVIDVQRLDPSTGTFGSVTYTIGTAGGKTILTIAPTQQGVTNECVNFLVYFISVCPGTPPKKKTILIKSFQICPKCPAVIPVTVGKASTTAPATAPPPPSPPTPPPAPKGKKKA